MNILPSPPIQDNNPHHKQIISTHAGAWLDINIVNLIEFLNVQAAIITLHSCEGHPTMRISDTILPVQEEDNAQKAYIHFYNASHMEVAVKLLHQIAEEISSLPVDNFEFSFQEIINDLPLYSETFEEKQKELGEFLRFLLAELPDNVMGNSPYYYNNSEGTLIENPYSWEYEISWTSAHPWMEPARHAPYQGYSLTACLRIPHEHVRIFNTYLGTRFQYNSSTDDIVPATAL